MENSAYKGISKGQDKKRILKRVILFSRSCRATRGGVELFNHNLAMSLADRQFHATELSEQQGLFNSYVTRVIRSVRASAGRRHQAVLIQYGSFLDVVFTLVLRLFFKKIFVIAHVSNTWKHLRRPAFRVLTIAIFRLAGARLLVISRDQEAVFAPLKPERIRTIVHPAFSRDTSTHSKRQGLIFVGRITAEKGVFDIIHAWQQLAEPRPRLRFFGQGTADTVAELTRRIEESGLTEALSYEGPVLDPAALAHLYATSHGTIYPSYADAFPLVMLESISQGTPCVISRVGEVPNFLGTDYPLLINSGSVSELTHAVELLTSSPRSNFISNELISKAKSFADGGIVRDLEQLGVVETL